MACWRWLGVLFIDVLEGMIIGVVASLVFVVYKSSRPHVSSLGRVPGVPGAYSDLTRHPENTPVPGVLIVRVDGQLYYANALTVRDRVKAMIAEMAAPPRAVIFDCRLLGCSIDVTGTEVLRGLVKELRGKGIDVYCCRRTRTRARVRPPRRACSTSSARITSSRPWMLAVRSLEAK